MIFHLIKTVLRNHAGQWRRAGRLRMTVTVIGLAGLPVIIVLQTHEMFRLWLQVPAFGEMFLLRFLSFSFLGLFVLLLFTGFTGALHHFYLANDLSLLLTMPLSLRSVFAVKFIEATQNGLATFIAFGLPLLVSMTLAFDAVWLPALLIPAALLFVMIATGLSLMVGIGLAQLFSVPRMRRAAVFIFGVFIVSGWAGLQFLRIERFNPASMDFDLEAAASFSQVVSRMNLNLLPSDWLVNVAFAAVKADWLGALPYFILLMSCAVMLLFAATSLRAGIKINTLTEGNTAVRRGRGRSFGALQLPLIYIQKELRLIFRDMRTLQGYILFTAVILVWPFLQQTGVIESSGTFDELAAYIAPVFVAVLASAAMTRQSVPMERRSFQYIRSAPTAIRRTLLVKAVVHISILSAAATVSVIITALRTALSFAESAIILAALLLFVVCGAGVGLFCGARFGRFDWSDPRHMLAVGWNPLSLVLAVIVAGIGAAMLFVGLMLDRLTLAFVLFFVYVCTVFYASILLSEKRLTRSDWL